MQHLEGGLLGCRVVRHRLRGDRARDGGAHALEQRQHRGRAARAVEPDDIGAGRLELTAGLVERDAVDRRLAGRGERRDHGQPRLFHHIDRDHGLAEVVVGLGDHQVGAFFDGPADLLAVHLAHDRARGNGIVRVECPGVADVPGNERVTFGGDLGSEPERVAVQRLEVALAADLAHLLAVTVVRERHHHLRAGAEELPVQLAHRVRKIEHDLGDVRPALQVATALELEQVALCAQHRPLGEPFEQAFHISIGGAAGQSRDRTPPRGRIARRNGRELLRPG